jgi:hypothetical protein
MKPSTWGTGAKRLADLTKPEATNPNQENQGRDGSHDRHPCFALRLVTDAGDEVSVMYESLVGSPAYNPSEGIAFVFEALHPAAWGRWEGGRWLVTIRGSGLGPVYHHLCHASQQFIRVGANGEGPGEGDVPRQEDEPEVTSITVERLAPGK